MRKTITGIVLSAAVYVAFAATTATLLPSGAGNYNSWTPSTGTTHYTLVNEATCNGNTNYVSTTVLNNRDSYQVSLASVPNGAVITGVSITPCASRNTNQTSGMAVFYRANGVDSANGGTYALTGTTPTNLSATNFTGLAISKNSSTTLEIGAVLLSGTGGAKLSRVATVVTYVNTPTAPFAVQSFVSTSTTPKKVNISWSNGLDAAGVNIEKSTDGVNFTQIYSTSTNITSYVENNTAGTYYYRLQNFNVVGTSGYSSTTVAVVP